MSIASINFNKITGKMKPMHAVNNGPCVAGPNQTRGNQDYYGAVGFPYARTHDASFSAHYGLEHTVDVHNIFRDFNADVNDPDSYDFIITDNYMAKMFKYGTKPFYRLGARIEHEIKKYGTIMPPDFQKWAEICEHIIAHYTKGWANGFFYDIEYWEIWNEPDLDSDDSTNKRCWSGTEVDFARFYTVASKHLKKKFPEFKIGGPASAGDEAWMSRFLDRIKKEDAPLDFLSWHWYWTQPYDMSIKATRIRKLLVEKGYGGAESILNEWNYVRGWTDEFVYSIKQIISMKGAAFFIACMIAGQNNDDLDMMMYYDAREGTFNGLFDYYTMQPLKGYYSFLTYSYLYKLQNAVEVSTDDENVYVVGAKNGDKYRALVCYYTENDNEGAKVVTVDTLGADMSGAKIFLLDDEHTMSEVLTAKFDGDKLKIRLERNSLLYIEK